MGGTHNATSHGNPIYRDPPLLGAHSQCSARPESTFALSEGMLDLNPHPLTNRRVRHRGANAESVGRGEGEDQIVVEGDAVVEILDADAFVFAVGAIVVHLEKHARDTVRRNAGAARDA